MRWLKIALTIVTVGASQVKSEDLISCGFCESTQASGVAMDVAWNKRKHLLQRESGSQEWLRFFREPQLVEQFAGSIVEFDCADPDDLTRSPSEGGVLTIARTLPGKLFFEPWQVIIPKELFDQCGLETFDFFDAILAHEAFHVRSGIQQQVEAPGELGIEAIRDSAYDLFKIAETLGLKSEKEGIERVQEIASSNLGTDNERLRAQLSEAEKVFYNSLMVSACTEALAHRVSGTPWEKLGELLWEKYWRDGDAYKSYYFQRHWQSIEFMKTMIGEGAERCLGLLDESSWYLEDKRNSNVTYNVLDTQ